MGKDAAAVYACVDSPAGEDPAKEACAVSAYGTAADSGGEGLSMRLWRWGSLWEDDG